MSDSLKRFLLVFALLVASAPSVLGFSMIGPLESWQVPAIGFGLVGDYGGPKDLGDGYRWNTRNIYYAADASFLDFFGPTGSTEIDKGVSVYNALTNLSTYSSNLTEWPLTTSRINETAQNLQLLDVKSMTMSWIAATIGLAPPERYTWNIHDRFLPPGGVCPVDEEYVVVQRNFDPATDVYSSFVNGILFDYTIIEGCTTSPILAVASVFGVDPTALSQTSTAVAGGIPSYYGTYAPVPGRFYTGLTRDDVGGLRYLYATNRMNVEDVNTNSLLLFTNKFSQLLVTSNLQLLTVQSLTNPPAALQTLYPGIIINSFSNIFSNVITTNITAFFTNPPLGSAGSAVLTLVTNFDTNVATLFVYNFANVVTNHKYTQGFVTTQTTNINFTTGPLGPAGSGNLTTNVTTTTTLSSFLNGDFYILPTNTFGVKILSTQLVKVIPITNTVVIATNAAGVTNLGQSFTMNIITYFTNYNYIVYPIQLVTNSVALRQGVDKINFIRRDFDSLLNTFWDPVTNYYTLTAVTNGVPSKQTFQRIITEPDIQFSSSDHIIGPATIAFISVFSTLIFDTNHVTFDGNGPGNIEPQTLLVFGKGGGPIFQNTGGFFQGEFNALVFPIWATFDGTTNAPIVYPDSASLADLENAVFFQILSGLLPNGSVSRNGPGNPYHTRLQAQGASPPFTWSLPAATTNNPVLPDGLTLSSDGTLSGSLANASVGTYDFTVQAVDAVGRVTQGEMILEVDP